MYNLTASDIKRLHYNVIYNRVVIPFFRVPKFVNIVGFDDISKVYR